MSRNAHGFKFLFLVFRAIREKKTKKKKANECYEYAKKSFVYSDKPDPVGGLPNINHIVVSRFSASTAYSSTPPPHNVVTD